MLAKAPKRTSSFLPSFNLRPLSFHFIPPLLAFDCLPSYRPILSFSFFPSCTFTLSFLPSFFCGSLLLSLRFLCCFSSSSSSRPPYLSDQGNWNLLNSQQYGDDDDDSSRRQGFPSEECVLALFSTIQAREEMNVSVSNPGAGLIASLV